MISPCGFLLILRVFCAESFVLFPASKWHGLLEYAVALRLGGFFGGNQGTAVYTKYVLIYFQNEQQLVAIKALEYLSEHLQDCRQLFAALK